MPKIIPCLWFDGQAEEAANFYASVFPNSTVTDVTRQGPDGPVVTATFSLDGREHVALNGGPQFPFTEAVSLQVLCGSQDEVDGYWAALTEGGEEGQCGWLKDRYGFSWQIVPTALLELTADPDPGRAQRAVAAMMTMRKIDVAELHRAADAT
jgi:predicted 3-demethylubiquinone-9 3-methyltransferase (glyoxalase superfamily)